MLGFSCNNVAYSLWTRTFIVTTHNMYLIYGGERRFGGFILPKAWCKQRSHFGYYKNSPKTKSNLATGNNESNFVDYDSYHIFARLSLDGRLKYRYRRRKSQTTWRRPGGYKMIFTSRPGPCQNHTMIMSS